MAAKGVSYNQLLAMGIPKPTLHGLLHKLMLAKSNVTTSPKISPEQRTSKVEENNKGQIVLPLFAVGGWTNARQGFGSSLTFFLSFLCQDKKGKKKKLSPSKITYESLLAMGIPKPPLHSVLHKLVLAKSSSTKHTYHPSTKQLSANSNSEIESTAQSTFNSLPCAGEYPLNKVLDLPNPTQASTNKTSEIEPTAQSIFHSLPCAGGRTPGRVSGRPRPFCSFLGQCQKGSKEKLGPSEITYEYLLALGIAKPTLHSLLHKLLLDKSYSTKHTYPSTIQLSANSNSEIEPTTQTPFNSLLCAGGRTPGRVLDLPNPTQASTNKTSEIEATAQSIFHSLPCAGGRTPGRVSGRPRPFCSFLGQYQKGSKEKLGPSEITYEYLLALGIPIFPLALSTISAGYYVAFINLVYNINKITLALFA